MAVDRRSVLKFIVGGAAGTLLTPIPWKSADDIAIWSQNWPWIPRIPDGKLGSKPGLLKMGGSDYGVLINTVEGQPITVAGNPKNLLSQGALDPLAASGVQMMYSPSRIEGPMQKDGNGFQSISWSRAQELLLEKLRSVKGKRDKLACISGERTSSCNEILSAFTSRMNSERFYLMPRDENTLQQAWQDLCNGTGTPGFDLENADTLLVLGPDLFESWGTCVRNQRILGQKQPKVIYVGPVQNNTAALAQEWIPLPPEQMSSLALGLAYRILEQEDPNLSGVQGGREFREFLSKNYSLQKLQNTLQIDPKMIRSLARSLLQARRPLVIPGTVSGQGGSKFDMFAALSLNIVLQRINQTGGLKALPQPPQVLKDAPGRNQVLGRELVLDWLGWMDHQQDMPELLLIYEANPAYALPGHDLQQGLASMSYKVSFSTFMDETAAQCDLILPNPFCLERLDDSFTPFGSGQLNYTLAEKVQEPWKDCRPTADILLGLAQELNLGLEMDPYLPFRDPPGQPYNLGLEVDSYQELLQAKAELLGADWNELKKGTSWSDQTTSEQDSLRLWSSEINSLSQGPQTQESSNFPLRLAATQKLKNGSDQIAIPPFALKTMLENELEDEMCYVRICRKTAREYNLKQGDRIRLESPAGKCEAKVNLDEGILPGVVDAPLGFGRSNWDEFSRGKGDNVHKLFNASRAQDRENAIWADTRLQIVKL
ncbi:MAG: menaquinone reductase molybdopterin-binding-like subunit QrcB [Desulfohalobiaceae bacterium]